MKCMGDHSFFFRHAPQIYGFAGGRTARPTPFPDNDKGLRNGGEPFDNPR